MNNFHSVLYLILLSACQTGTGAFLVTTHQVRVAPTKIFSTTNKATLPEGLINVVKIDPSTYGSEDDQVMQVASYRNQLTSPEQMIAKQQAKRDSFDPIQSALQGLKIGLGIGSVAGIISAIGAENGASIQDQVFTGLKNFVVIGGTTVRGKIARSIYGIK